MTAASPPSIADILDALAETTSSLDGVLATLPPQDWHRPTGCPRWDVQDVVSHIIGLEDQLAGQPDPDHELPKGLDEGMDGDTRRFEIQVDSRRATAPEKILWQFRSSTARGLERRRSDDRAPDEVVDGPFGTRMPYWRLLTLRTFDCFAHEQDIRRAVGRPGNLDGKAAAIVGDFVARALTGLLPRRLAGLDGHGVVIEVVSDVGVPVRTITVGDAANDPVTTLIISFGDLIAFACGRADADEQHVGVRGDPDVAGQVLAALGFTP